MPSFRITDKELVSLMKQAGSFLITQRETVNGVDTESLRRAELAVVVAALQAAGINKDYVRTDGIDQLLGKIVSEVTSSTDGIVVKYRDGTVETLDINAGGLAFDEMSYDAESGYLHLTMNGNDVVDPCYIGGTGGGGAAGSKLTFGVYTPSTFSVLESAGKAEITYKFISVDTETKVPTGSGNLAVYVGGVLKSTSVVEQGDSLTIDVFPYLSQGANTVKLTLTDSYGASATRNFTVNLDSFTLAWNLGKTEKNTGELQIYITPTGNGNKTIYLLVDGLVKQTQVVSTTGRRISFTLTLDEGAHVISTYGTLVSGGVTMESERLTCAVAQTVEGSNNVVIAANLPLEEVAQYTTISIPYRVIDPNNNPADVSLLVNNAVYETDTVDQGEQTWTYRPAVSGNLTLGILSGGKKWEKTIKVTSLSSEIAEVTDNLVLKVDPTAMTSLEEWAYGSASIVLSKGFDQHNGGLTVDDEGIRCIRVKKGDRMTIRHPLFSTDAKKNGSNFKFIYKVEHSSDYDATAISCLNGNIGMSIKSNSVMVRSEQTILEYPTCEGYKTELECNIEADAEDRVMMLWERGTPAKAAIYAENDGFSQATPQEITIGGDDCDVLIYMIRAYSRDLTKEEIKANYIADGKDATEIVNRKDRNTVYDGTGKLDPELTAINNPDLHVLVWHAPGVSTAKSQEITGRVTHRYVRGGARHTWTAEGVVQKAQGTSSLGYVQAGCNEDYSFEQGFNLEDGTHIDAYAMTDDSIPVAYLNYKTNVASQEHINNILLSEWLNRYQPNIRPARASNPKVRDTIEGHMAVMFFHNPGSEATQVGPYMVQPDETIFYSLGCLNNSKKNAEVFAQNDEDDAYCIEVNNNISAQCRFKSDDLSTETWDNDGNFQFRYISDNVNEAQAKRNFQNFLTFVTSCDDTQATNMVLDTVQTVDGQTFAVDSVEYRRAKYKAEAPLHMNMDSVLYHQVMTLVFSQVDNRSKNTFWGWSKKAQRWHLNFQYDNDTTMGNDNEGGLTLRYGYLDTDQIGTRDVFNAADNVVFAMNRVCFAEELHATFISLESAGAFNLEAFGNLCDQVQDMACESLWIEDAWRKSIDTYTELGTSAYISMLNGKKRLQRRNFLYFQRAFMSSYHIGSSYANTYSATVRGYTPKEYIGVKPESVMTITPYCDLFVTVRAGSNNIQKRTLAGEPVVLDLGDSSMNDTEIYVRNAPFIQDLGRLAQLYPGYIDVAECHRLKRVDIGSSVSGYANTNMTGVDTKNAASLEYVNVENCPNMASELNLSTNIMVREVYAKGSGITGITFAEWGRLKIAQLNAITSILAHSLKLVESFTLEGYDALTALNIEDCPGINTLLIAANALNINRVRLLGIDWKTTVSAYDTLIRLCNAQGIDDDGYDTTKSVLGGAVYFDAISATKYNSLTTKIPTIQFSYGTYLEEHTVTYQNHDGTILLVQMVEHGGAAKEPVFAGLIPAPTKASTVEHNFTFYSWDKDAGFVTEDMVLTATYSQSDRYYSVQFVDWDGVVLESYVVINHGSARYNGVDLVRSGYLWTGWDQKATDVVSDMTITASYVYPTMPSSVKDMSQYDYIYSDEASDKAAYTFGEFYAICKSGVASQYFAPGQKVRCVLDTSVINDTEFIFVLHSFGHYELVDGTGMSHADFYMKGIMVNSHRMNPTNTNVNGWDACEMRTWLNETVFPCLPPAWRSIITPAYTLASAGNSSANILKSADLLRIPSHAEVGFDVSAVPYCNEVNGNANEIAFKLYTDNNSRIKKTFNGTGAAQGWWLRSPDPSGSTNFRGVYNGGGANSNSAASGNYVCLGFCV